MWRIGEICGVSKMEEYTHKGLFAYCIPVYIKFDRFGTADIKGRNYICDKLLSALLFIREKLKYSDETGLIITG